MANEESFLFRDIPVLRKRVHRLGLATNYGLDDRGFHAALERGLNYVFWPVRSEAKSTALREALHRDRERLVVAAVPTLGLMGWSVRRGAEKALRSLGTDYIDILQLGWLGRASAWTKGTVDELVKLREEGKVRAIGVSIHDRPRAGRLAADSPLDMLMIRYNAAHPGAERDIFPHLSERPAAKGRPAFIVAYTATSWGKLLERPEGWTGPVATAGDCYRFALTSPHVDLVLCGPANQAQLEENLAALEKGPLSSEELAWMRELGQRVHAKNGIPFAPR